MSKPADIPQDVWDAACKVAEPINDTTILHSLIVEGAVRAILAAKAEEREACAGYHDDLVAQHEAFAEGSPMDAAKHHKTMARRHAHYAAAIRKRGGE